MTKVLITGGCGFIGSNLVKWLCNNGYLVRVLDDLSLGRETNLDGLPIEFLEGSVLNMDLVETTMKGCTTIFHLAAKSSLPHFDADPAEATNVNIRGFMNVACAAAKAGCARMVYASTSHVYTGNPLPWREDLPIHPHSFYEASLACRDVLAEAVFHHLHLPCIGLRFGAVYGPNEWHKGNTASMPSLFLWSILAKRAPTIYGDGEQTRDFIHVDDVVKANIRAMLTPLNQGVFNVGTGIATSFNNLITELMEITGIWVNPVHVSNPLKNYVASGQLDTAKAWEQLKFRAEIPLRTGLRRLVEINKERQT